jgi:nicotinate-nucleotide adenylyltransferase
LKIGIFGGTFNPPHLGHLRLAEEVAPAHGLNRILFMPCYIPPHKNTKEIAPPEDRLEMTRLACGGNEVFDVSDMEIRVGGPSYTVTTLEAFRRWSEDEVFFVLGTDSLREIHTWWKYERLFSLAHFIVVTRPGLDFATAWGEVPAGMRDCFQDRGDHLVHSTDTHLIPSPVLGLSISSTTVRQLSRQGRSIRYLVTEPVRSYILEKKLYRN